MNRDHNEALVAFLTAFEERLETAPLVERRAQPGDKPIDGRRADRPVTDAFAYWESKSDRAD